MVAYHTRQVAGGRGWENELLGFHAVRQGGRGQACRKERGLSRLIGGAASRHPRRDERRALLLVRGRDLLQEEAFPASFKKGQELHCLSFLSFRHAARGSSPYRESGYARAAAPVKLDLPEVLIRDRGYLCNTRPHDVSAGHTPGAADPSPANIFPARRSLRQPASCSPLWCRRRRRGSPGRAFVRRT